MIVIWMLRYLSTVSSIITKYCNELTLKQFPIDVDEDIDDIAALVQAAQDTQSTSPTSLTSFIYFIRLRRIESKIQNTFYRVDRPTETSSVIIQGFLDELSAWKRAIPPEYFDRKDTKYEPFDGIDVFVSITHDRLYLGIVN